MTELGKLLMLLTENSKNKNDNYNPFYAKWVKSNLEDGTLTANRYFKDITL